MKNFSSKEEIYLQNIIPVKTWILLKQDSLCFDPGMWSGKTGRMTTNTGFLFAQEWQLQS